jgi:hypothetical protein
MTNRIRLRHLLKKEIYKMLNESFLLKENYPESTVQNILSKWGIKPGDAEEKAAKELINTFAKQKDSLKNKLDIIVLPDELRNNDKYLNIFNYSFKDLVNLLRSIPENSEKVKKAAIEKFNKQENIDKATAQSYTARFMKNVEKLRLGAKEGITDDEGNEIFSTQQIKDLIPSNLLNKERFLDPRNWSWQPFEQMLDALFPSQKTAEGEPINTATGGADKVYDNNGIEIWKGDDVHKCISYNPINPETKRKKYGWCVTQVGNTNYDYYRFGDKSPTFYFVFNRNKSSAPLHSPFTDPYHAIVIQVTADKKTYIVTDADNKGDRSTDRTQVKGWEGVKEYVDADTWAAIKDLKDYFKPISLSSLERARKMASGKNLTLDEFKELITSDKILYVQGKAQKGQLTPEILAILPKIKIPYEGRTTTLANIAIDSGQKFTYQDLKDYPALAKRYAIFRDRHDDEGNMIYKTPIPLPFIKYLNDEAKQRYIKKFKDALNATVVEKYFGEQYAKEWVDDQLQKFEYIEPQMQKYITNPKLKQLYDMYSKLYDSWVFESIKTPEKYDYNNALSAADQIANPIPLSVDQWKKLSNQERKIIIDLVLKNDKNPKYENFLAAAPYIVKDKEKTYVLLLKDNSNPETIYDSKWVLVDAFSGNTVNDDINSISQIGNNSLIQLIPNPDPKTNAFHRIYDISDLKIKK